MTVRKVLVTGAPVRVLVRDATRAALLADLGIEIVQGDLCDPAALCEAMRGLDLTFQAVPVATWREEYADGEWSGVGASEQASPRLPAQAEMPRLT
jgi:uncharacterized protein YbjT (DUF2867 family)